jgi:hypothetical protein
MIRPSKKKRPIQVKKSKIDKRFNQKNPEKEGFLRGVSLDSHNMLNISHPVGWLFSFTFLY